MKWQVADEWIGISSAGFYRDVVGVSRALAKWGVSKGDRIAILSENRPQWAIVDFAALLIGAVVVPIYATLTPEQTAYILSDAGVQVVFVSSRKQLEKISGLTNRPKTIVVMDDI